MVTAPSFGHIRLDVSRALGGGRAAELPLLSVLFMAVVADW